MDDLHNLRVVCKVMHRACSDPSIGQRVALLRTFWEDMQWNEPDRYYALLALLVSVGNPEACTIKGILSRVVVGRHDVGAYLYALMMYKNNGSAVDDDIANMYIPRVECEDGSSARRSTGSKKLCNDGCWVCHKEAAYLVNRVTWHGHGDPLPPAPVHDDFSCARGNCGKVKGREQAMLFCNEDCTICHEIVAFERRMGIDN
uniref:Uncharacterized protein n=1 Tax=Setaria italica TaxID=4555 RepID=K3ZN97_SETIT